MTGRPEIGARLDHLCISSREPERLAQFFGRAFGMNVINAEPAGFRCAASEGELLISSGPVNMAAYAAYAFDDRATLQGYRERLSALGAAVTPFSTPRFRDDAVRVIDPDGNAVVFGLLARSTSSTPEASATRLQHVVYRTPQLDAMAAFYEARLGFVVSDRVLDDEGVLRACFLRTDAEHHSLALFRAAAARLDHHSYETRDWESIRLWADRMAHERIPIFWGVGRHGPGNDLFFMIKDPDDNLVEVSAELEVCASSRAAGRWPHEPRTLNLWGSAIMRS